MNNEDKIRWIKATLANDETSTDAELIEHFTSQGVELLEAQTWVAQRAQYLDTDLSWLPNGGKGVIERLERMKEGQ